MISKGEPSPEEVRKAEQTQLGKGNNNEESKTLIQAVIDELVERIGSLELEVAILKATLGQIKPPTQQEEESQDDSGSYL